MPRSDSAASKKSSDWSYGVVIGLVVYALSAGPIHGLYYTEQLSEETWGVMKRVYYPIDLIEGRLPGGEPIHTYRYWWYINMKYPRFPPGMGPP